MAMYLHRAAHASTNKVWKDLNFQKQNAAINPGFTEDNWNNFEDESSAGFILLIDLHILSWSGTVIV